MSSNNLSIVVLCGGKGTKMGKIAAKNKCKSLIPILNRPILFYTLTWLKSLPNKTIYLCIDRNEILQEVNQAAIEAGLKSYKIFHDNGSGVMPILCNLYNELPEKVMVMCGNQPIPTEDLRKFIETNSPIILGLYRETSDVPPIIIRARQINNHFRVESVEERQNLGLSENEYYLSRPYVIAKKLLLKNKLFQKRMELEFKIWWDNRIETSGILLDVPYEIHYPDDVSQLKNFLGKHDF